MLDLLFSGQQNLLILVAAFVIGGIFKTHGLFLPVFTAIAQKVRSKRLALLSISLIAGCLPVEGRVSVSAPILDSLVTTPKEKQGCCTGHARGKMGVLDFVATHHYYLWSPLEKSLILLMAGLGLTYAQVLSYTIWPILVYLVFLLGVVFLYVKDEDIEIVTVRKPWAVSELLNVLPFLLGIVVSIWLPPYYVFPFVAVNYAVKYKVGFKQAFSYVNWRTLALVAGIIVLANAIKANSGFISEWMLLNRQPDIAGVFVLSMSILLGFTASLMMGSSSKYAGICVALTTIFGMAYFPLILMAEFAGYLLSPVHKCGAISASYFQTRPLEFYKCVGALALLMMACGFIQIL